MIAALMSLAGVAAAQEQAPAGDANAGHRIFKAVGCWECHGDVGQGGGFSGPRIGPSALPYAAFLQQLRTPQNSMPPYEPKVLSDHDAANIYAYLKSLPKAQPAKDIPLLSNLN